MRGRAGPMVTDEAARLLTGRLMLPTGVVLLPFSPRTAPLPDSVRLFDVRWGPSGPGRDRFRGAAVLSEREDFVLDLGDQLDFQQLLTVLWPQSAGLLAEVIARYMRRGPFDIIVTERSPVGGIVDPVDLARMGCRPPVRSTLPDGQEQIGFDSFRLETEDEDGNVKLAVDRWTATRRLDRTIVVQTTVLTTGLPGLRDGDR